MMVLKLFLSLSSSLVVLFLLTACQEKPTSDVAKIHWDRDMCNRCVMVISDRQNTAQTKDPSNGKKYLFDDIGCMILWFNEESVPWENDAVLWVTDKESGEWIDARAAFYDTQNVTPMAYGFSAHKTKESIKAGEEIIDYVEVKRRVIAIGK